MSGDKLGGWHGVSKCDLMLTKFPIEGKSFL